MRVAMRPRTQAFHSVESVRVCCRSRWAKFCVLPEELWPVAGERQQAETLADPWEDTLRAILDERAAPRDAIRGRRPK